MGIIYAIKNLANGKLYVGSTKDEHARKKQHFTDLRCGRHYNWHLQRAFEFYGEQAFQWQVLELVVDDLLLEQEKHWIVHLDTCDKMNGYNISINPMAPMRGRKHRKETLKIMQERSLKGSAHPLSKYTESDVVKAARKAAEGGVPSATK